MLTETATAQEAVDAILTRNQVNGLLVRNCRYLKSHCSIRPSLPPQYERPSITSEGINPYLGMLPFPVARHCWYIHVAM
jgi:hypothetical protein